MAGKYTGELISVVQRASILSDNQEITEEDLFLHSRSPKNIDTLEKELICEVLESTAGNLDRSVSRFWAQQKIF